MNLPIKHSTFLENSPFYVVILPAFLCQFHCFFSSFFCPIPSLGACQPCPHFYWGYCLSSLCSQWLRQQVGYTLWVDFKRVLRLFSSSVFEVLIFLLDLVTFGDVVHSVSWFLNFQCESKSIVGPEYLKIYMDNFKCISYCSKEKKN